MKSNPRLLLIFASLALFLGLLLISIGIISQSNPGDKDRQLTIEDLKPTPTTEIGVESDYSGSAEVVRVVDGDTIEVLINNKIYKVRYIGIDTPETVDPRRPVGCFGKEASSENKKLVEGKTVILEKDISNTDKYGRLLRYIYLQEDNNLIFINDYLVRQGFAKASTFPPDVKYSEQFLEAEREARTNNRGLWGKCNL